MYYLNGIICGGYRSENPGYANGRRQFRRMLWLWLTKVVGWSDVDKSGSNWDNPEIAGASDGATDVTDPEIFNSATGGFSGIDPSSSNDRYFLIVSGFTDSTRDGLYEIWKVVSDTQIKIRKAYSGVHSDGFPLNETGLTWRVDELKNRTNKIPAIGDWWVVGGSGTGGTFHLRCVSDNSPTHSPDKYDISPYDDWDAVAHDWKAPARYTSQAGYWTEPWSDSVMVFGVADATHCALWVRAYNYDISGGVSYPNIYYFGDINPFRPTVDTRPVVSIAKQANGNWLEWHNYQQGNVSMLAGDDSQSNNAGFLYPSLYGANGTWILDNVKKTKSGHSGKFYGLPIIIATRETGKEEIRGYLKSFEAFHRYGDRVGTPFGSTLNKIRFSHCCLPWNGSKQYRYVF